MNTVLKFHDLLYYDLFSNIICSVGLLIIFCDENIKLNTRLSLSLLARKGGQKR